MFYVLYKRVLNISNYYYYHRLKWFFCGALLQTALDDVPSPNKDFIYHLL